MITCLLLENNLFTSNMGHFCVASFKYTLFTVHFDLIILKTGINMVAEVSFLKGITYKLTERRTRVASALQLGCQ